MEAELDALVAVETARQDAGLPATVVGRLVELDPSAGPMVDLPLNNTGRLLPARTLIPLDASHVQGEVALIFEEGEITRPIILGVLQQWGEQRPHRLQRVDETAQVQVKHDEDSIVLTAAREITLQCGKSSITLTSAGKLLLRGAYLLSRSSGVNRIKGGSVQIN